MVFTATSKNSFRHVSWSVWKMIRNLFPAAIELKRKRPGVGFDSDDDDTDDDFDCTICHTDKVAVNSLVTNLTSVAEAFQQKDDFRILTNEALVESACHSPDLAFRMLHEDDVNAWNNFLSIFKKRSYKKLMSEEPDETAKQVLLPLNIPPSRNFAEEAEIDTESHDGGRVAFVEKIFRPIVCTNHRRPIYSALFQPNASDSKAPHSLSARVLCMEENAYRDFIGHFVAAALMLVPEPSEENSSTHQYIAAAANFCEQVKLDRYCHPRFFADCKATPPSSDSERFYVSTLDASVPFRLEMTPCNDVNCCTFFNDWQSTESCLRIATQREVGTSKSSAGVAGDPVAIDSDVEIMESTLTKFSLRVFDVESGASFDKVLSDLASCSGLPASRESDGLAAPRRSTRKRKARFPFGAIKDEETIHANLDHNVAALRLQIFEQCCSKDAPFELDHSLKLAVLARPDTDWPVVLDVESESKTEDVQPLPKTVDLSFELCSEPLKGLCESLLGAKVGVSLFSPGERIVVLRQAVADPSAAGIQKDAFMEHLINISNATADDKEAGNGKDRKKVRAERGFTGTFLSSGPNKNTALSGTASSEVVEAEHRKTSGAVVDDCAKGQASTSNVIVSAPAQLHSPCSGDSIEASIKARAIDATDGSDDVVNVSVESASTNGAARKIAKRTRVNAPKVKATKVDEDWFNNKSSEKDDDPSDRPTFRNEKAPRRRKPAVESHLVTATVEEEVSHEQGLADRVAYLLRQNEDIPPSTHDLCGFAAEQAVLNHPSCKKAEDLVNPAYEMYLTLRAS